MLRKRETVMRKRYKHKELGGFRKVASKGEGLTRLVWDAELAGLADYLTAASKQSAHDVVLTLLEAMLELNEIEEPPWDESTEGPLMVTRKGKAVLNPALRKVAPEKYERQLSFDRLHAVVNRELAQFQFRPYANRAWERGRWYVNWLVSPQNHEPRELRRGGTQMSAGTAVQLILDFARAGQLSRLRRCSRCQKWFFAGFRHQTFCSTPCQQKHYTHSDEWRAKRREYMRGYRQQTMAPRSTRRK